MAVAAAGTGILTGTDFMTPRTERVNGDFGAQLVMGNDRLTVMADAALLLGRLGVLSVMAGFTMNSGILEVLGMRRFQLWRLDWMVTVRTVYTEILTVHLVWKVDLANRRSKDNSFRRLLSVFRRLLGWGLCRNQEGHSNNAEKWERQKPASGESNTRNPHS